MKQASRIRIMEKCIERTRTPKGITVQIFVDILLVLAVGIPVLFTYVSGVPFIQGFHCNDENLMHPYRPESVSTTLLLLGGFGLSIGTIFLVEMLNTLDKRCKGTSRVRDDLSYCGKTYGIFLIGFVILQLMIEVVKHKLGFLRPNFFDVCRPKYNTSLCPGYITEYTCTTTEHDAGEVRDSRLSFPSGHAALSMYIAAYFSIFTQKRLQIQFSNILKLFIQIGLVFLALMCGIGRIRDNKHHPADVIGGFLLGMTVAIIMYKAIGDRVLACPQIGIRSKPSIRTINRTDFCCTCANTSEPQTPAPLLPNEYPQSLSNGVASPPSLKDFTFSARRHMSAPSATSPLDVPDNV